MDTPSTPVTADFSSTPPKRTKIVLLGDQSVGKTSLITRSAQDVVTPSKVLTFIWFHAQIHVRYI
jgi:GTPase SAR1 family protein